MLFACIELMIYAKHLV